jgi:ATP-dependent DNA helicase DinG
LLSEELKGAIRDAYSAILAGKALTPRWGQRQMIAEIANTLARIPAPGEAACGLPAVCVIEAGTGYRQDHRLRGGGHPGGPGANKAW